MKKAVIYTRFSPRKNASECESCETQVELCRTYAGQRVWDIIATFKDRDVSGKDEYREKLWQAIETLPKGGILLVYKRDRLARNVFLSEQINRAVKMRGATIEAVAGDVDGDGPEQIMVRQILASLAEYERKMIASRTSHAMLQRQRNGQRMGRHPPYGWRLDPADNKLLEPDPVEQTALDAIRLLLDDGGNPHSVAVSMNGGFLPAARGGRWHAKTIAKIAKRL